MLASLLACASASDLAYASANNWALKALTFSSILAEALAPDSSFNLVSL